MGTLRGELRGEVGTLRGEIGNLGGEIGNLRDEIGNLRDEFRDGIKSEIGMLRQNDLRHLAEGIKGLDARIDRVENRVTESIGGLERRTTAAITDVEKRLTKSMLRLEAGMANPPAASMSA